MQYMGGKSRISKRIAGVISNEIYGRKIADCVADSKRGRERERESNTLVSLFCGTCSVESKLTCFDKIICNDNHEYLIEMLRGVQNGYELPEFITPEDYKYIRTHKDENKVLTGFVGFGCSFGGKWFGGYARNKGGTNYALQSKTSLLKDMATLKNATFICADYRDVVLPEGAVIYADPPYANTTGYNHEKFDSVAFWDYMREIGKEHQVFISEQEAPNDFECIWEKQFTRTLDRNKSNQFKVSEKLFTYRK